MLLYFRTALVYNRRELWEGVIPQIVWGVNQTKNKNCNRKEPQLTLWDIFLLLYRIVSAKRKERRAQCDLSTCPSFSERLSNFHIVKGSSQLYLVLQLRLQIQKIRRYSRCESFWHQIPTIHRNNVESYTIYTDIYFDAQRVNFWLCSCQNHPKNNWNLSWIGRIHRAQTEHKIECQNHFIYEDKLRTAEENLLSSGQNKYTE